MTTKYFANKPIKHGFKHYRPGEEITGFTGWWRYWQLLRYNYVNKVDTAGAPTISTIVPGNLSLVVNVTEPAEPDAFSNYEYQLDGGSWVALSPVDTDPPFTISGLTNGVTYAVRVRALDAAGNGTQSNSVNGTPRTVPAKPTVLAATPTGTDVSVSFTAGNSGGNAITNYQYSLDAGAWTALDPADAATPVTITGLETGTEYTVLLRAVNAAGAGAESDPLVFTTDSVPDAPTALAATIGNETVSIAFTPGALNGAALVEYQHSLNDGTDWFGLTPDSVGSPYVMSLPNDVEYTVVLRAVNAIGAGAASDPVVFTPVDQVPAAPTNLVATPGDGQLSIAFTAGDDGGSAITNYQYRVAPSTTYIAFDPVDTATPVVVTGLTNDVEVTVYIRAINAAGNGASASVTGTPTGI